MNDEDVYSAWGEEGFQRLIAAFYSRVASDDILRPLYPEADLTAAEQRLRDFLIYRFGGPPRYIEQRGHPRLRMRHAPFPVDPAASQRWLKLMGEALDEVRTPREIRAVLLPYFESTAAAMINRG